MRRFILSLVVLATAISGANAQYTLEPAFPSLSFSSPVDLQSAHDGTNRLFVVEQQGLIQVFDNDAATASSSTYLDINTLVDTGSEMGLLGLAFHPEFATNGYFFVNYTTFQNGPLRTVIARYRADPPNAMAVEDSTETIFLEFNQTATNHNAGQLAFGSDDLLYIGTGDGGSTPQAAPDLTSLLGKMLRIDVDTPGVGTPYSIPDGNPWKGSLIFQEEIFARGLRNPWRFSIDEYEGQTTLWVSDVGQNAWEEIDIIEVGKNYGWPTREGDNCYSPPSGCQILGFEPPVWEYPHSGLDGTIVGGYVYRGTALPSLFGDYVYGDYLSGRIWALRYDGVNTYNRQLIDGPNFSLASFGTDDQNELYACYLSGGIFKLENPNAVDTPATATRPNVALRQNTPNPFNPRTSIHVDIVEDTHVVVSIHDVRGRFVRTLHDAAMATGAHTLTWNGRDEADAPVASGVYVVRATSGVDEARIRVVLTR